MFKPLSIEKTSSRSSGKKSIAALLLLLAAASFLLSMDINSPFKFCDHDGSSGAHWGVIARNYTRYGFLRTKFGAVQNGGEAAPGEYIFATHHSPLTPISVSLFLRAFGVHEWSVRIVFLISALGALAMLFLLCSEFLGNKTAAIACALMLLMPGYLIFSKGPHTSSVALFFCLAGVYAYMRWSKKEPPGPPIAASILIFIATLSAWEAYFLIPAVMLHNHLTKRRRIVNFLAAALGFLSLSIYFIHVIILNGAAQVESNVRYGLFYRGGIYNILKNPWFPLIYLKQVIYWAWFLFTPPLFICGVLTLGLLLISKPARKILHAEVILPLFCFGILGYFVFTNLNYNHSDRLCYLAPFFVISTALLIKECRNRLRSYFLKNIFIVFTAILLTANVYFITRPVVLLLRNNDALRDYGALGANTCAREIYETGKMKAITDKFTGKKDLLLVNAWCPQIRFYLDRNTREGINTPEKLQKIIADPALKDKAKLFIFIGLPGYRDDSDMLRYLAGGCRLLGSFYNNNILIFELD